MNLAGGGGGGNRIQSRPLQRAPSPPPLAVAAIAMAPASAPKRAKSNVTNPYKKETPRHSIAEDPKVSKKKRFAEKYRAQALHHSNRAGRDSGSFSGGGHAVSSLSALDLLRTSHQWRSSWRQGTCSSADSRLLRDQNGVPLRPRLFLFPWYDYAPKKLVSQKLQIHYNSYNGGDHREAERRPTPQQQQREGVWELGTGITELAGEGGSGKTQICLSLCVTCALTPLLFPREERNATCSFTAPNLQEVHNKHYTSIYVTMGEGIPSSVLARRLRKIVCARQKIDEPNNETTDVLSRIGLLVIRNEEQFDELVHRDLPQLLASQNHDTLGHCGQHNTKIGLVAFDGIAGLFRFSDPLFQRSRDPNFYQQRGWRLLRASAQLRRLSDVYDVPMLITNQVTACIPPIEGGGEASSLLPTDERVVPALGLLWSNCVTTRILLLRKDGMAVTLPNRNDDRGSQNRMEVAKIKEMRARKARMLQSLNMPEERDVWFVIDTGDVAAVA